MDRAEFDHLVRDLLANCYDYAALETHPLAHFFSSAGEGQKSRAEILRSVVLQAVDALRPPDSEKPTRAVEWRPYQILHGRYVEGASLIELQSRLALSARQLRREHGRAVTAVASFLWDRFHLSEPGILPLERSSPGLEPTPGGEVEISAPGYTIRSEALDLAEVVHGAIGIFQPLSQREGCLLSTSLPDDLPLVKADRVILRQILLALFDYVLQIHLPGGIDVGAARDRDWVKLWIEFVDPGISPQVETGRLIRPGEEDASPLETALYWLNRLKVDITQEKTPHGMIRFYLALPQAGQEILLVVDDHEQAIRLFDRYLRKTYVRVAGVQEPDKVLPLARQLAPRAIVLDIMLPEIDGWEILQALKADPETQAIPVLVCSVWNVPDLAFSLGAAGFLKKPVMQKDLLEALTRLKILDIPAGSSPEGFPPRASIPDG